MVFDREERRLLHSGQDLVRNAHASANDAYDHLHRMRVIDNGISVEQQEDDQDSVLNFWRRMLRIRKQYPGIFAFGRFDIHDVNNEAIMTYTKTSYDGKPEALLVALNFTDEAQPLYIPQSLSSFKLELLASAVSAPDSSRLSGWEGRVYLAKASENSVL